MAHPVRQPEFRSLVLRKLIERLRERVDPDYRFASPGPIPWAPLRRPLRQSRVGLITTAGLHRRDDQAFDPEANPLGDLSFRQIPHLTGRDELCTDAVYVDPQHTAIDPEVALPAIALQTLMQRGRLAHVAPHHYSFCGGIVRPLPGLIQRVDTLTRQILAERVDVLVLLPTCSLCVQTVCILARELESRSVPTVCISLLAELTEIVGAPRTLAVRFPFGAPCGMPGDREFQRSVLWEALQLLETSARPGIVQESRHRWRGEVPEVV